MTLQEAIATQPAWLTWWLNWMMVGAFILPVALFIWRETRIAAIATILTGVASAFGVSMLYDMLGYVKILGLPHIFFWTPLALYLLVVLRRDDVPKYARWIVMVVLATIVVSLAFDYTDAVRYILGERAPLVTAPEG